jgi:hypothetical protein
MNNEFEDIIASLGELKQITPDDAFKKHIEKIAVTNRSSVNPFATFFALRLALLIAAVLIAGTGSIVLASKQSKQGDLLYPIKQVVNHLTTPAKTPTSQKTLKKSFVSPTLTPAAAPTQTSSVSPLLKQTEIKAIAIPTIAPVTIATPAPTQTPSQIHAVVPANTNIQINPVPVSVSVGSNTQSQNESNDAGSEESPQAGKETSLLPDVKISNPIGTLRL